MSEQPRLPNYKEWAMREYWDPSEFGRLAVGLTGYAQYDLNSATLNQPANERALEVAQFVLRSMTEKTLNERPTPREYVEWADRRDIGLPDGLREAVAKYEPPAPIEGSRKSEAGETKKRETMLRLIGGMAIYGYGVDLDHPFADPAQDIIKDLEKLGVSVSKDTLAEYLKAAKALLDKKGKKNQ